MPAKQLPCRRMQGTGSGPGASDHAGRVGSGAPRSRVAFRHALRPLSVWRGVPLWVKAGSVAGVVLIALNMWMIWTDRGSYALRVFLSIVTALVIVALPARQWLHDYRRRGEPRTSVNRREPW